MVMSDSEDSSEDEEAQLITPAVERNFLDTLIKIKKNDPSLHDKNATCFKDEDFDLAMAAKEKKSKRMTARDVQRETLLKGGAEAIALEEERIEKMSKLKTPMEEEADLRKAFIDAGNDSESDDDLLAFKQKSKKEKQDEAAADKVFAEEQEEKRSKSEKQMLNRIWESSDDRLSEKDKFLRDYFLHKKWEADTDKIQGDTGFDSDGPASGSEGEDYEDKADEFEHKYNFRFEEEGGTQIVGHSRNVLGSVRQKDDKRKRKRQEKKERKEEERKIKAEEIKRLKNLKRQEIQNRLKTIAEITGNTGEHAADYLEGDWNPEEHDSQMQQVIGDDYYEQEEELDESELLKNPDNKEFEGIDEAYAPDGSSWKQEENQEDGDWQEGQDQEWNENENQEGQEENEADVPKNDRDDGHPDWYLCDSCFIPIPGGKKMFVCRVCEDFVQCQKCFRTVGQEHRMTKKTVPSYCMPPEDYKGKYFIPEGADEEEEKPVDSRKKNIADEVHQLDYEDIIAGMPVRFKYTQVAPNNFGMDTDFILQTDEKKLNQLVGLKKLAPYREKEMGKINVKRKRKQLEFGGGKKPKTQDENEWGGKWQRGEKQTTYDDEDYSGHAKNQTRVDQVVKKMKGGKVAVSQDRAAAYGAQLPRSQPIHEKKKKKKVDGSNNNNNNTTSEKKSKKKKKKSKEVSA
eukprot:gene9-775_t